MPRGNQKDRKKKGEGDVLSLKTRTKPRLARSAFSPSVVGGVLFWLGLGVTWFSLLRFALPSVAYSVPSKLTEFFPQFFLFLVLVAIGLYLSSRGAKEMESPRHTGGVFAYSGAAMLLVCAAMLLVLWEGGFTATDVRFWYRVTYLLSVVGAGAWSIRRRVR